MFVNVGEAKIWESKRQKRLGILIDRDLKFDEYVLTQSKKADKKLTTLIRVSKFTTFGQRRDIMRDLLNLSLAIAHLFGCFVGDKLMQG